MERFNSWIKQRVTNRQYPESTVLENYLLFELTFIQISKKLPCEQIAFISNDENEAHTSDNCGMRDADEVKALDFLYKITDPEYVSLNCVYENEKKKARKDHRLRKFPPLSQWLPESDLGMHLTSFHLNLRSGPSNQAAILRVYWHKDQAGRLVKYTTMKHKPSMYSSSCVALKSGNQFSENRIIFGKITKICRHSFSQKNNVITFVHWFGDTQYDQTSGLYSVNTDTTMPFHRAVPITELSKPLIHAVDAILPNKLWILNFRR